ncbi:hypothetical protein [Longimicrobium sp.]|uniref:hypothetical protein n=1 Tax=Longimicrobium sp. TaxID=2029185 RepID=UPI003B3B7213
MAKLKLNLDQLTVDSFDTAVKSAKKGTVFAEQCTCWTQCGQNTCPGCPTCGGCDTWDATCASCDGTCDSCGQTCYHSDCRTCDTCNPTIANGLSCCL